MFKVESKIVITGTKKWIIPFLHQVTILEDVSKLTDTAEITLPRNVLWKIDKENTTFKTPIKRGDKIQVWLGYDNKLTKRFSGYIRSVGVQTPLVIKCEDSMYLLKLKPVKPKGFKNATLDTVIKYLLQGTGLDFKLIDKGIKLGNYRITKPTVAQELQVLKETYLLSAYFRNIDDKDVLYIGLAYPTDNRKRIKFVHGKNVISENLEYRKAEDIQAKVEAVSFDKRNKKTTIEIGDKEGDLIQIRIDGLTEKELKKFAQQALSRYKKSGFKGSFTAFGLPETHKCDMVDYTSSDGTKGVYLVKTNEITCGLEGFRQDIELGNPISI